MNRPQALALVAGHAAGQLQASDLGETTGLTDLQIAELSEADIARLEWAREQVIGRLHRMGRPEADDDGPDVVVGLELSRP